ncbi:hypothetical protein [Pseudoclavibacter sp. CFCC 13611]|uniref:hypothetical protein n=1 Tax=Pseudoclavibacter sp. CFCC 13611 TaxID=2615178 RepID=UPI001301864F|nr:hypothetical protein [Pseudoclavibacter sp. CFCC 13611]KAB1663359.1 hypothetical protein F8O08_06285 [Pseudoclavibacter sp. CFCC 13611]
MDIDAVKTLPLADQMTFLRGRILGESLSMEAVARYVYVRLSGGSNLEEALDTPQQFKKLAVDCANFVSSSERLSKRIKPLAMTVIENAAVLYERRNRFVHDALRHDLISEERWARFKLWRRKGEKGEPLPSPEPVSSEEMIDLVFDLIRETWRLRGLLWSLIGTSQEVSPFLTHAFDPQWDGSINIVNDGPGELPQR